MDHITKSYTHEIRSDAAIRLDIHQVGIAASVRILFKPETRFLNCQLINSQHHEAFASGEMAISNDGKMEAMPANYS